MAKRLLLVKPAGRDRSAFRHFLEAAGYEVLESPDGSEADRLTGDFEPDMVLLDHETGSDARLAMRSRLRADDGEAVPIIEMCFTLPTSFSAAATVLDRMTDRAG